jgi:hypothetical protein
MVSSMLWWVRRVQKGAQKAVAVSSWACVRIVWACAGVADVIPAFCAVEGVFSDQPADKLLCSCGRARESVARIGEADLLVGNGQIRADPARVRVFPENHFRMITSRPHCVRGVGPVGVGWVGSFNGRRSLQPQPDHGRIWPYVRS